MLIITLLQTSSAAAFVVRSVEVVGRGFRNRLSFTERNEIADVFVPELAERLADAVTDTNILPDETLGVMGLPDFLFESGRLVLSGLRCLVTEAENGTRQIMLRFRSFVGPIAAAFRGELGLLQHSFAAREAIAVDALDTIAMPLFDIARIGKSVPDSEALRRSLDARLNAISHRSEDLEFMLVLLKRYIGHQIHQIDESDTAASNQVSDQRRTRLKTQN